MPGIDEPAEQTVPDDLLALFPKWSGTVVVWSKVDRLEEGRRAPDANELRIEVEKELCRIFRYFLHGGRQIKVNETNLLPFDPLMRMERTWSEKVLNEHYKPAGNGRGKGEGRRKERHFEAEVIWEEALKVGQGEAQVRITLYPPEVVRKRGMGGDELARKLYVKDREGLISFVRLEREVSYTNVPRIFPRGVADADRFIGIEVAFKPELDDYFGIRNVKRGVEPHGELRDRLRAILAKYLPTARKKLDEMWGVAAREQAASDGEHASVVTAATEADRTLPKPRAKGLETAEEQQRAFDDLANDAVGADDTKEKDRKAYVERLQKLPFVVESVDFPGTQFIDVQHVAGKVLIRLNTRHRFYREMWAPVRELSTQEPGTVSGADAVKAARRTIEALTLLVIAYGKAESMHDYPHDQYGDLRSYWGQFLDSLMGKVKDVV